MKNIFLVNANIWIRRIPWIICIISIIYLLVCLLLWAINPSASYLPFSVGLPAPMKVFIAEQARFSMVYPKTWVAGETIHGSHGDKEIVASIARFGRSFPRVSIARRQFQEDDGVYDVVEWGQTRAKRELGYVFVSQEELESQNYQGVLAEYTLKNITLTGSYVRHCEDWYTLVDNMGYALSFCIEEQDWPIAQDVFKEMIQSFVVIKN